MAKLKSGQAAIFSTSKNCTFFKDKSFLHVTKSLLEVVKLQSDKSFWPPENIFDGN